ncbi:hypothetical protein C8R43DRAFT_1029162 [Mycena crocata]|nr:hypothetical protein C8R43DRAFT_1029162 [Mycena crocata]
MTARHLCIKAMKIASPSTKTSLHKMLPVSYPQELIDRFVEYSAGELSVLSLVDRRFLSRARRLVYSDLTVHVCCDPRIHRNYRRCGTSHCVVTLSRLLRSRHCTIPRAVTRLILSGKDVANIVHLDYIWSTVSHTGGMDNTNVVLPVLKHFTDVNQLELVDIQWFNLSSRLTNAFFSSVRHLTIDGGRFYSGPEALLFILGNLPRLESLTVLRASWPSQVGCPDDAPWYIIYIMNFQYLFPRFGLIFVPIHFAWLATRSLKSLLPRQRHTLRGPLQHLSLDSTVDIALVRWMLEQKPVLARLPSAELRVPSSKRYSAAKKVQTILDILPSLSDLVIKWGPYDNALPDLPSLAVHRELRVIDLRIQVGIISWESCVGWLRDCLGTITSKCFTTLILNVVITPEELLAACCPTLSDGAAEDPIFSRRAPGTRWIQTLEKVDVRVVVKKSYSYTGSRESPSPSETWNTCQRRIPSLFPISFQKGLLHVQGTVGSDL